MAPPVLETATALPAEEVPTVIVPVYQPPTVQALIRDFASHKPAFIAQLPHSIYAAPVRKDILHRCVIWQRDAQRQGTHAVKGRADVRGTTRKFAPQKGRGAARVGSRRVPLYRGGGVAHGPVPRSHATELQVKVRELGMRSALAVKYTTDELVFTTPITDASIPEGKTKSLAAILNKHYPPRSAAGVTLAGKHEHRKYSSVLIVSGIEQSPTKLNRAASNLPDVKVIPASDINVYDVLKHEYLVLDHAARKFLEWRLKPSLTSLVSRRRS
ncbi:ribosomal protein L4/L1 family-domain-containing protein [Catenaria anguillulae PL171]|uniref:Large ribosomal subunit protein uL4m n=1 Tax=Catenaria anguillulae PL171 TaxID=765915 RepID=A0A1Y2HWN8_9FUNG|nr:ribosomal protein L4/L1 family-domain-containing protein [Catenaria anguillulae PL171]